MSKKYWGDLPPSGGAILACGGATLPYGGATLPYGGATLPYGGATLAYGGATSGQKWTTRTNLMCSRMRCLVDWVVLQTENKAPPWRAPVFQSSFQL
jgi:hypothetical protein